MNNKEQLDWSYATIVALHDLFKKLSVDVGKRYILEMEFAETVGKVLGSLKMKEITQTLKEVKHD